jgi:hypothetical protein
MSDVEEEDVVEIQDGIFLGNNYKPPSFFKRQISDPISNFTHLLGIKFILFLVFSQMIGKGMLMGLIGGVMLPIFKTKFNVTAQELEIYTMLCLLPWSIKPLIGLCSDFIVICGYNKRGWLVIGSVIGITSLGVLFGITTTVEGGNTLWITIFAFIGVNFQVSLYDLLSEAKYSEIRNEKHELGSNASTFANGLITFGSLIVLTFIGTLSDAQLYWVIFLLALLFGSSPIIPTLLGWMPEVHYVNSVKCVQLNEIKRDGTTPKILVVAFCGLSGILASVLTTIVSAEVGLGVAFGLLVLCLAGCWKYFPEEITQVALYQVITTLSAPSIGSALSYFFTATPECLPDGPHFTFAYYISWAGIVGQLLGLVAVFLYTKFLSKMKFRRVLLLTTVLQALGGFSDLFIILRWNIALGISDKWAYMIGQAVLEPVVDMLNWIPSSALISIFVEKGMEASCFAFLAGISNFARMTTKLSGTIIFSMAGIQTCQFDALWWLVLICHIGAPMIIGIPAVFLIPNVEQNHKK